MSSRKLARSSARFVTALGAWGVLTASRCGGDAQTPSAPGALVWSDEFDGAKGAPPDGSKWTFDAGGSGFGNHQLEYDTSSADNASTDGEGHLLITARAESYQGHAYTSARLITRGLFQQESGRFEARMKLPTGKGMWPAFWLLGANDQTDGWPKCGEIDVMENKGEEPSIIHGSAHGPGYSGGGALTAAYTLPGGARFDEDFHVFAVDWEGTRITYSVDGNAYQTIDASRVGRTNWVFDHPFFVIVNLAVGGDYVSPPDATTTFPQSLVIDWIRVYAPST